MVCPHGQEELSQCEHFSYKGEGVYFSRFVRTAPNQITGKVLRRFLLSALLLLKQIRNVGST